MNYTKIYAAVLAVIPTACSQEPEPAPHEAPRTITFAAQTADTRTELGADDYVLWSVGDHIGVYSDKALRDDGGSVDNIPLPLSGGAGTSTGTFGSSLAWGIGVHNFYAYYPYREPAGTAPAAVSGVLAAVQSQSSPSVPATGPYDFMWARAQVDPSGSSIPVNLTFTHPFCIVEFGLSTVDPSLAGRELTRIELAAVDGTALAGDFTIDLTASAPQPVFTDGHSSSVALELAGGFALGRGAPSKAWLVMAPADLTGTDVRIILSMTDTTVTINKPGRVFQAQHVYSVTLDPGSVTDLNADGVYSNCYMTVASGERRYIFDATVQGNRSSAGGFEPRTMNPASTRVLWQTGNAGDAAVVGDVSLEAGGKIGFTSGAAGSAVIGAFDASGALLWSWHIWNCDYVPASMDQLYINRAGREFTMMGYNLGALNNTPGSPDAYGLLYQWGRKDPFIGAASLKENVGSTAFVNDNSAPTRNDPDFGWGTTTAAAATGTVEYAVAHPTVFITGTLASGADWLLSPIDGLWGAGTEKTIYDPCPKGYRVPFEDAWTRFTATGVKTYNSDEFNVSNFPDATADGGLKFYIRSDGSGPTSYYPYTKYRVAAFGSLDNLFPVTYLWADSSKQLYADCFDYQHTVQIDPKAYTGRAYGFGVRCMKE